MIPEISKPPPLKILLADDDPYILSALKKELEKEGHLVTSVQDGMSAVAVLEKEKIDLVITDIFMEILDGFDVLNKAKEIDPDIKVFILTGYGNMTYAVDALRMDADDFLSKPCDLEELLFRIGYCFEKEKKMKRL